MQAQGTARRGGAAFIWTWGAITGVILGVIQIVLSQLSLGVTATIIDLLVWLIGFFLIGLFAARRTGRAGTGSLAGLVAGLVSGLLSVLVTVIEIAANGAQITQAINQITQQAKQQGQNLSPDQIHTAAVIGIILGLVLVVAIELGLGAGIGALGGLVGRRQAAPATPYVESMWTPPPPPPPGPSRPQE